MIIYKIIKTANEKGMTNLLYVAWYIMSELNLAQGKYTVTYGIVNNSLIQLEKADYANEYIMLLFKYNMYKVLRFKGQDVNSQICLAQANYITKKWGITFEFDTNPDHFIAQVDPDDESNVPPKDYETIDPYEIVESSDNAEAHGEQSESEE